MFFECGALHSLVQIAALHRFVKVIDDLFVREIAGGLTFGKHSAVAAHQPCGSPRLDCVRLEFDALALGAL